MLTIDAAAVEAIVAHARRDHPDEACGIVAGAAGDTAGGAAGSDADTAGGAAGSDADTVGTVAGSADPRVATRHIAMQNAARSMTFYEFDSQEYLRVWREMDDRDEEPVVIYHSHTATEAYPSRTDVSFAGWPEAHYVLVSTRDPDMAEIRSFRIVDGVVAEEPVRVVNATVDSMAVQPYLFGQTPTTVDYECPA